MSHQVLTCWKEVAEYLGKGIRTVQRWERTLQLPIQRPENGRYKTSIFISTEDLDLWMRERMTTRVSEITPEVPPIKDEDALILELEVLREENAALRVRLGMAARRHPSLMWADNTNLDLLIRTTRLMQRSVQLQQQHYLLQQQHDLAMGNARRLEREYRGLSYGRRNAIPSSENTRRLNPGSFRFDSQPPKSGYDFLPTGGD